MQVWLYDENGWPSGAAGGIATEQPRYRRKYLTLPLEKRLINRENILAVFCHSFLRNAFVYSRGGVVCADRAAAV